jgi:hypothetical protein
MNSTAPFGEPDADKLAGLVFELAAQLHIERSHRLALETALIRSGLISPDAVAEATDTTQFLSLARQELDQSMRKLLRVLLENGDLRTPLRPEIPNDAGGQD